MYMPLSCWDKTMAATFMICMKTNEISKSGQWQKFHALLKVAPFFFHLGVQALLRDWD